METTSFGHNTREQKKRFQEALGESRDTPASESEFLYRPVIGGQGEFPNREF